MDDPAQKNTTGADVDVLREEFKTIASRIVIVEQKAREEAKNSQDAIDALQDNLREPKQQLRAIRRLAWSIGVIGLSVAVAFAAYISASSTTRAALLRSALRHRTEPGCTRSL